MCGIFRCSRGNNWTGAEYSAEGRTQEYHCGVEYSALPNFVNLLEYSAELEKKLFRRGRGIFRSSRIITPAEYSVPFYEILLHYLVLNTVYFVEGAEYSALVKLIHMRRR